MVGFRFCSRLFLAWQQDLRYISLCECVNWKKLLRKKSRAPQHGFQPTTHETADYAAFKEALNSFLYALPIGTLKRISISRISIVLPFTAATLSKFTMKDL